MAKRNMPTKNEEIKDEPKQVKSSKPEETVTSPLVVVNCHLLNVREGPGKGYKVLFEVPRDTKLRVDGMDGDWLYIHLDGNEKKNGCVLGSFTTLLY